MRPDLTTGVTHKYGIVGLNFKLAGGVKGILPLAMLCCCGLCCRGEAMKRPPYWPVIIKEFVFSRLELALTEEEQARGLMERTDLADDGGMIFVFEDDQVRSFWMKNTLIELDILYLDRHGRIVSMHTMPPEPPRGRDESERAYEMRLPTYSSRQPARYALELKGGQAKLAGCMVGDVLELGTAELQRLRRESTRPRPRP